MDELLKQAIQLVIDKKQGSVFLLKRNLNIGVNRASFLIDEMEKMKVIGKYNGGAPREVLVTNINEVAF